MSTWKEGSVPRYEFRAFATSFEDVERAIRETAPCEDVSECSETYLVPPGPEDRNVKIRGDRLEVKRQLELDRRLERWAPTGKERFPLSRELVRGELLPLLGLADVSLEREQYAPGELVEALTRPHLDLVVTGVFKRRSRFTVDGCATEITEVILGGEALRSVSVESEDADAVLAVIERIGLDRYANEGYPRAIQRIARSRALDSVPG